MAFSQSESRWYGRQPMKDVHRQLSSNISFFLREVAQNSRLVCATQPSKWPAFFLELGGCTLELGGFTKLKGSNNTDRVLINYN